jgi:hypothetical protein
MDCHRLLVRYYSLNFLKILSESNFAERRFPMNLPQDFLEFLEFLETQQIDSRSIRYYIWKQHSTQRRMPHWLILEI